MSKISRLLRRMYLRFYRWYEIRDYQRSMKRMQALRRRYELLLRKGPDPPWQKNSLKDLIETIKRNGVYNDMDD